MHSKMHKTDLTCSLTNANFLRHRLPKTQWWLHLQQLLRIMAKHQPIYEREAEDEVF